MEKTDFEALSIEEVMKKIEDGEFAADEALELEKQGKNRKTLVGILEKMIETPNLPETVKAVFVENTKFNRTLYVAEQVEEFSKEDFDILLAAKVIRPVDAALKA